MKNNNINKQSEHNNNTGLAARTNSYKKTYSKTRDHRAAVRAYCHGNNWLTENAKSTGNW